MSSRARRRQKRTTGLSWAPAIKVRWLANQRRTTSCGFPSQLIRAQWLIRRAVWPQFRMLATVSPTLTGRGDRYILTKVGQLRTYPENARCYLPIRRILNDMHSQILKRAGAVLLAVGIIDGIVTIVRLAVAGPWPAVLDSVAVGAGIVLLRGGPRAALWIRTLAVFLLAACIMLVIAAPLFQPLDLTITEIRLDPAAFADKAASVIAVLCMTLWITPRLGQPPI